MKPGRLVDGHHSGLAGATADQWFGMCCEMADEGARRFAVTEAHGEAAREGIRRFCRHRGFGVVQFHDGPGQGECAILYDKRAMTVRHAVLLLLTEKTLTTARKAPICAPLACFEFNDGATDWRSAAHLPAHLEGASGFRRGWPTKVHRSAVDGWRRQLREAGAPPATTTLTFDANLNQRLPWVQAWAKAKFPGLRSAWRRPFGKAGTFHRRIIDHALTGLHVLWFKGRARLISPCPGMDHRGFVFTVRLPRNPKEKP